MDKAKQNEQARIRRKNNIKSARLNDRIGYLRKRQKAMAESRFDEFFISNTLVESKKILPTFVLA